MTQVGEGPQAGEAEPAVMTFGAPTVGEVLAERYELIEHINDDSAGRLVWRGIDVVLRRPVAVLLRYPGGDSAMEMLQAAVRASRIVHAGLAGVYDAIDEGERAYVVREWVDGCSLRELVAGQQPLDATRATSIGHAVAGAIAALHASGMVHGNVHPGTVLIGDEGRVVLADARTDGDLGPEMDVRAIGGILYFAMTGHWPHAETAAGRNGSRKPSAALLDAVRDASGTIAAPRQMRAGVPSYLDNMTMDLLDAKLPAPAADALAAELGRLDTPTEEPYLEQVGPLRFVAGADEPSEPVPSSRRKMAIGTVGLVAIAVVGLLLGVSLIATGGNSKDETANPPTAAPTEPSTPGGPAKPETVKLNADQVRVVDPDGQRDELDGIAAVVDGDDNTGWSTDSYQGSPKFGQLKRGMGILVDLGKAREVTSVRVVLSATGATAELRTGSIDAPSTKSGDNKILDSYNRVGEPLTDHPGTTMTFSAFEPGKKYRYLLFWITEMPQTGEGKFKIGVQEITVQARP